MQKNIKLVAIALTVTLGDLFFTAAVFGLYAIATRTIARSEAVVSGQQPGVELA